MSYGQVCGIAGRQNGTTNVRNLTQEIVRKWSVPTPTDAPFERGPNLYPGELVVIRGTR
jgi:hypothetical protein